MYPQLFSTTAPDLTDFLPDKVFFIWNNAGQTTNVLQHWFFSQAIPEWLSWLMIFSAGAAVLMLIVGGGMMLVSGVQEDLHSKGIKVILWALAGLVIMVLAVVIVQIVNNLPFTTGKKIDMHSIPLPTTTGNLPVGPLSTGLIPDIINIILSITYTVTVAMILYAGVLYVIRNGEEESQNKAKNIFIRGILGLIVITISYALVYGVTQLLFSK